MGWRWSNVRLGAEPVAGGTRFAVWTTRARTCHVRLYGASAGSRDVFLAAEGDGLFRTTVLGVAHGTRYAVLLDGEEVRDPYARFLPDGVDAPAVVWSRRHAFRYPNVARPLAEHVFYELHVGTFTAAGTYQGALERLPALVDLGVTAIELMPIAAFAGTRGWGYDGVAHFAPFAGYGSPDDLCAFIDSAHGLGLAVLLDVVYNHFGPAGNVLPRYAREYFDEEETTLWGAAPNMAHPAMRKYVLDSVRSWLEDYRFDGLRFDAIGTIVDRSERHILREVADLASSIGPRRLLIAEGDRNDPATVTATGFHGVWTDDFHHEMHVTLTNERDGYYAAYTGGAAALADTIAHGWRYRGAQYPPTGKPRGKPANGVPFDAFIYCLQNHDQVGNRAFGERLTEHVTPDALAAATMVLLFLPTTPLLFMGQEWAATAPFLYFTEHDGELGAKVTQGRRKEFARFAAFSDPHVRETIPDPQAFTTFARSRLDWSERDRGYHARLLELHRTLLALRRDDRVLRAGARSSLEAREEGGALVVDRWTGRDGRRLIANLSEGEVTFHTPARASLLIASARGTEPRSPLPPHRAMILAYDRAP